MGVIEGDTRSLDSSSHNPRKDRGCWAAAEPE